MASRFLGGCQRSFWELGCGCRLSGYWLRFQHECKTVRVCLGEHLSYGGIISAWCYRLYRRSVRVR